MSRCKCVCATVHNLCTCASSDANAIGVLQRDDWDRMIGQALHHRHRLTKPACASRPPGRPSSCWERDCQPAVGGRGALMKRAAALLLRAQLTQQAQGCSPALRCTVSGPGTYLHGVRCARGCSVDVSRAYCSQACDAYKIVLCWASGRSQMRLDGLLNQHGILPNSGSLCCAGRRGTAAGPCHPSATLADSG